MRAVVQRVRSARVMVHDRETEREIARIDHGLVVFVGVERGDGPGDAGYIASKVDRKSTRLNSSHIQKSRMPSSA